MWHTTNDELDNETREAIGRAKRYIIPFVLFVFILLVPTVYYGSNQQAKRYKASSIASVVTRKYIDTPNHMLPMIRLRYLDQEFYFPGSYQYYSSLKLGDSLYKPSGSTNFFLVEYTDSTRVLRELTDSN